MGGHCIILDRRRGGEENRSEKERVGHPLFDPSSLPSLSRARAFFRLFARLVYEHGRVREFDTTRRCTGDGQVGFAIEKAITRLRFRSELSASLGGSGQSYGAQNSFGIGHRWCLPPRSGYEAHLLCSSAEEDASRLEHSHFDSLPPQVPTLN